jgi:MFS family permease
MLFFGFQMLLPTLPVYVQKLGGQDTMAGLVLGIFTVSAVLIRPFTGKLLDTHGRKIILIAGLVIFFVSVIGYNWAPTLIILLVLRFIHGFGWGAASTATGTIAADIIPKSRLGEGMGYYGLAGTIAMALAPLVGLTIIARYSFTVLFAFSATLVVLAMLVANFIVYIDVAKVKATGAEKVKPALFEKAAFRPSLVIFFITMTYGAVVAFIALYAGHQQVENIGVFFTVYAITLTVTRPMAGRIADRNGFEKTIIPGMVLIALAMLILSQANSLELFLLTGIVYGLGFGSVQPSLQAMVVKNVPPNRRGAANGTFFSAFDLGIGAGSVIGGGLAQTLGYSQMYLLAIIPALIGILVYYFYGRRQ